MSQIPDIVGRTFRFALDIVKLAEELDVSEMLVFTSENYLDSLDMMHAEYEILDTFDHFHTTKITGNFLNHKTRQEALHKYYLVSASGSEVSK